VLAISSCSPLPLRTSGAWRSHGIHRRLAKSAGTEPKDHRYRLLPQTTAPDVPDGLTQVINMPDQCGVFQRNRSTAGIALSDFGLISFHGEAPFEIIFVISEMLVIVGVLLGVIR
jgi:hypothetical protein